MLRPSSSSLLPCFVGMVLIFSPEAWAGTGSSLDAKAPAVASSPIGLPADPNHDLPPAPSATPKPDDPTPPMAYPIPKSSLKSNPSQSPTTSAPNPAFDLTDVAQDLTRLSQEAVILCVHAGQHNNAGMLLEAKFTEFYSATSSLFINARDLPMAKSIFETMEKIALKIDSVLGAKPSSTVTTVSSSKDPAPDPAGPNSLSETWTQIKQRMTGGKEALNRHLGGSTTR